MQDELNLLDVTRILLINLIFAERKSVQTLRSGPCNLRGMTESEFIPQRLQLSSDDHKLFRFFFAKRSLDEGHQGKAALLVGLPLALLHSDILKSLLTIFGDISAVLMNEPQVAMGSRKNCLDGKPAF